MHQQCGLSVEPLVLKTHEENFRKIIYFIGISMNV